LVDLQGNLVCDSITHAYEQGDGVWVPKVPPGRYQCFLGTHSLDGVHSFQTYNIPVPGHWGILFHQGNVETESTGCELLGDTEGTLEGHEAVLNSGDAFARFMKLQNGAPSFWLDVIDATGANDVKSDGGDQGVDTQTSA